MSNDLPDNIPESWILTLEGNYSDLNSQYTQDHYEADVQLAGKIKKGEKLPPNVYDVVNVQPAPNTNSVATDGDQIILEIPVEPIEPMEVNAETVAPNPIVNGSKQKKKSRPKRGGSVVAEEEVLDGEALKILLLAHPNSGRQFLNCIHFERKTRVALCTIIATKMLEDARVGDPVAEREITTAEYWYWVKQVPLVFPNEKKFLGEYFVEGVTHTSNGNRRKLNHRGLLYNKVVNGRVRVHKLNSALTEHQTNQDNGGQVAESEITADSQASGEAAASLDANLEKELTEALEITDDLCVLWSGTSNFRLRKKLDPHEYFNKYPIATHQDGFKLFDMDFEHLYPGKNTLLIESWPTSAKKILKHCQRKGGLPELSSFSAKKPSDELLAALLLPYLFSVINIPNAGVSQSDGRKKPLKPTKKQAQDSFLCICQVAGDLQRTIEKQRVECKKFGQTLQPFIVIVGELANPVFYVVVNQCKYLMKNVTAAIDLCFKIFFVLDVAYPKPAERIWKFIQNYAYHIETNDPKGMNMQVLSLINALESL